MRTVTVIGGGEHARVVIEAARSRSDLWLVDGFCDVQPCDETQQRLGVPWLGDDTRALARTGDRLYVLGIGAVGIGGPRAAIVERFEKASSRFATIVHANAWVSPTADVAHGVVVFAGAVVQTGARIGAHAVIGSGAIVEHDVTFGEFVQLGPRVAIGGGAAIGAGSYVGIGASVRDHVTIGSRATIAMGAVVVANVDDGAVMVGVPARVRR